jgi:lipopolysaccharide/colanic/teichoic acid biosynthesis glycosyltransferase
MAFDRRETTTLLIGDFFILVLSLWVTLALRNLALPEYSYFEANIVPFAPMFVLSIAIFYIAGLYEKQTRPIRRVMGVRILGAQATTVAISAILFFILPLNIAPKTILMMYLGISVVAESVWRFHRMKHELKQEKRIPAMLVGSGVAVLELYEEVRENSRYLMHFVGHVETAHASEGEVAQAISDAISRGARAIVLDTSDAHVVRDLSAIYSRMSDGITFLEFAALYEEIFDRVPPGLLDTGHLLESLPKHRTIYDASKRLIDIVIALAGSLASLPLVAPAAAVLWLQNGTALIHQERVGKGGRIFRIVKLRSRALPYDDRGDPELQKKNIVTPFGKFLRRSRIDELPQLWNVLRGELSLIGPRPELPNIVTVYEREIPQYHMRHLIAPGLSGWAQIHDYDAPRGAADVGRTRRKLSFDLYYLKHRSFGLDLAIALKSVRALLAFSGT